MTDNLLPQDSGELSIWADTEVPDLETPALEGSHQVDVLVVGGGFTGLSCALHLAEQGTSVMLFEAKNFGFGGS
ncbi:MAG: FAD-dependent oxidoreductase, partial [Gammaproteobacteria bacterium]|nr:FAD-dependent oxidoreductase [Gammaproteobacteria bacterium]